MDLPTDQYATKDYWDERYTDEVDYDWFAGYKSFAHHIARTVDTKRVFNCGLTTRFDAISSTEIFKVINKPQQLHTNYTTRS